VDYPVFPSIFNSSKAYLCVSECRLKAHKGMLRANESSPQANKSSAVALGVFGRSGTVLADYMTEEELARELNVTKRTLQRWHNRRIGPPRVMIGRKPFYRRGSVVSWIDNRELNFDEQKPPFSRRARRSAR
jgi:hypothetical protein